MKTEEVTVVENTNESPRSTFKKTAVKAMKKGSLAAKEAAVTVAVSPVKLVNHAIYGACYGVAYGAVYSALMIGKAFPENSTIRKGLHEGLESAIKDFDAQHQVTEIQGEVVIDA